MTMASAAIPLSLLFTRTGPITTDFKIDQASEPRLPRHLDATCGAALRPPILEAQSFSVQIVLSCG